MITEISLDQKEHKVCFRYRKIAFHLSLLAANLIWGTSFLFTKLLLAHIPPVTVAFVRFMIASFFLILYIKVVHRDWIKIFPEDIVPFALLGLFGISIYYYGENISLQTITISNASLILSLIPAVTMLLSVIIFGEQSSLLNFAGLAIAFFGAFFIIFKDTEFSSVGKFDIGYIYIFIATLSFSIYSVLGKKLMLKRSPVQVTTFTFIFGSIFLLPFVCHEWIGLERSVAKLTKSGSMIFLNLCYLSFVCSIGGYFLWNWGLKGIEPGKASVYLNIIPLTAVVLGVLFLDEQVSLEIAIGGLLILSGIYLTNFSWKGSKDK